MKRPPCRADWVVAVLTVCVIFLTSLTARAVPVDSEPRPWLAQPGSGPAPVVASAPERTSWRGTFLAGSALLIGVAAWYARKFGQFGPKLPQSNRLRILSSVRVGPKGYIALIAVGDRTMLVGANDATVRRLAWIEGEQTESSAPAPTSSETEPEQAQPQTGSNFGSLLRGLIGSGPKRAGSLRAKTTAGKSTVERSAPTAKGSAQAVAQETTDIVDWSPRLKGGQGRPAKATEGENGSAEGREAPSGGSAPSKESPIEGQASGLLGKNPRRRS